MFTFKNKTILILSAEGWGTNLLSKHLYANELSKYNTVFFLHTTPHPSQNDFIETLSNKQVTIIQLKKVARGIFKLPSLFIDLQNKWIIKKIQHKINQPIDVVWSFDQSKFQNLKQFNAKIAIFHPVDYIQLAQSFVGKIANSADVVLSVSKAILATIHTNTPKYFINHGLDEIFFQEHTKIEPPNFIEQHEINVGYVGNLNMKWIDYKNLISTVQQNPSLNFVFIGPDAASNLGGNTIQPELLALKKLSNAKFIGQKTKNELVELLPFFDVFWLCYDGEKFPIEVSNSHKILEYLSAGKVVISNIIETYETSAILEIAKSNLLISTQLKKVTSQLDFYNSPEKQQQRIAFAKENTYAKQIERIEKIINSLNG